MNYYIQKAKPLLYIGIVILVALIGLSAYMITSGNKTSEVEPIEHSTQEELIHSHGDIKPDTTPINPRSDRVFIKDFHKLEDTIDLDTRENIEHRLYLATVKASGNKPGLYTGVVRPESYNVISSNTSNVTKVLVDIEPAKLTYEVTVVLQKGRRSGVIYIACASEEQRISQSATCRQGAA